MNTTGVYVFDSNSILEKAYELLCIFYANKEISRQSDPDDEHAPLASLEKRFFESKISRLLIEIAASFRVISDQMYKLPETDPKRKAFYDLLNAVDKYEFGTFDELELTLRETCNKIIHTEVFEPHFKDGYEGHERDYAYWGGEDPKSMKWKHATGIVRLSGKKGKGKWHVLLEVSVFVTAVFKVFS